MEIKASDGNMRQLLTLYTKGVRKLHLVAAQSKHPKYNYSQLQFVMVPAN